MKLAAALLLGTGLARLAAADPSPEPAAERVGDANLESTEHRQGMTFSAAIGPSFTLGGGSVGTGTGGSVSLRLGHVASPSSEIFVEMHGGAQFHKNGTMGGLVANNYTSLLLGVRYWIGPSLWIRLMGGVGHFQGNDVLLANKTTGDIKLFGPAGGFGAGVDLARWRGLVLGIEMYSINMINREGLLSLNSLGLGLSFD